MKVDRASPVSFCVDAVLLQLAILAFGDIAAFVDAGIAIAGAAGAAAAVAGVVGVDFRHWLIKV